MVKITSVAELKEIKENTLNQMSQSNNIKVVVGMGTCGIAAGAGETMQAIEKEIKKQNLNDVVVSLTGCIGLCVQEPLVEIKKPGKQRVVFRLVDETKAKHIIEQYVINDFVNKDWVVS